jgi:agmatine deiminase
VRTPAEEGFRMPAEWAPHRRCWMAWPCREDMWGEAIEDARRAYAEVATAICRFEPVTMIVRPDLTASVSLYCSQQGISVLPLPHDDSWTRDTGPTFLVDGQGNLAGVDWTFNGWGNVHPRHEEDARMAMRILEHVGARRFPCDLVMEGGGVHVDGEGTGLVCAQSVLDPRRNPGLSREAAEAVLKAHLGLEKLIWLEEGLLGDETAGHVDNLACWARPGVVIAAVADDVDDENYPILRRNLEVLRATTDAQGRALEVLMLPIPKARQGRDGRRLTLSYVNFYLANGAVILPAFDDPADRVAYRTLAAAFPDREPVQIEALAILEGGGGIHCITQQQPEP